MLFSSYTSTMLKGRGDWLKFRFFCEFNHKNAAYWMYRNSPLDAPELSILINLARVGSTEGVKDYFCSHPKRQDLESYCLNAATEYNHPEIVSLFLKRGVKVFPEAFDVASRWGFKDILLMLLDSGAFISFDALQYAAEFGHEDIVDILIAHKAPMSWRARLNVKCPKIKEKLDAYAKVVEEVP